MLNQTVNVNQPLVSVLMTSYNRENLIAQSIESVVTSTYQNWELIISDDCSVDNTFQIAQTYAAKDTRIKVYRNNKNLGDYPNRNKAASYAKGKYLKYLDSDDLLYYYGLEVIVNYMERFPKAGWGLASIAEDEQPFPICIEPTTIYLESFSKNDHFGRAPGSSIIKKEVFEALGGFSGARMIGDTELWMKCAMYYPLVKFPFDMYWSRVHENRESASAYANKKYDELRKKLFYSILSSPDCPLNKEQIEGIKKLFRRKNIKNKLFAFINKYRR